MADLRECAQCGAPFVPGREHARFCSTTCRMTWNAEHDGVAAAPLVAIDWSVTAMAEAAGRFAWAGTWERSRAAGAVSETVWWITLVDATLVRYHRRDYENALVVQSIELRRKIEGTLGGLRFVRNRLGCSVDPAEFIRRPSEADASGWVWTSQPEPPLTGLPDSSRAWELSRYRSYQARLAGRDIARTFARCAVFLEQAAQRAKASEASEARAGGAHR